MQVVRAHFMRTIPGPTLRHSGRFVHTPKSTPCPPFSEPLPLDIRAHWDRIALQQLARRAAELDAENDSLASQPNNAERLADH